MNFLPILEIFAKLVIYLNHVLRTGAIDMNRFTDL